MKRLLVLALSVMMTLSLFISCQNQPSSNGVASVRLAPQTDKRSLTAAVEEIDENSLEWHYRATKKTETNFKFGETEDTKLEAKDSVIELSQGKWEFKLWAVKVDDSNASIKIYEGVSDGEVLVQSASEPTVVPIDVYSEVEGSTGYIYFDKALTVTLRDTTSTTVVSPTHVAYKAASADESSWSTRQFSSADGVKVSDLAAGKYDITVYYAGVDGCTYASEVKTITVMSGRTTTIAGSIDESTASAKFDVKIIKKVVSAAISSDSATTITATAAPVATSESATSVKFPASSISGTTATLTMEVAQVGSNFEISGTTTEGSQSLAKLDLSLDVDGKSVTTFEGSEAVTVTTYIAKGLSNVNVNYTGTDGDQPTDVQYDSGTGKLTFKTTHFSEFVVTTTDSFVAYNKSTNKGYASLAAAISEAGEGDAILLLKDADESSLSEINDKKVSVDLNGKKLSLSQTLTIDDSSIAFSNGSISSTSNKYGIILTSNSSLTLENKVEYVAVDWAIRINKHTKSCYLNILDSTVETTGGAFAIQTDATKEESSDVNVTIKNSTIKADVNSEDEDSTGFMFNVSGKVVIENSTISGRRQGAIFRGGEYTVKNSTFKSTGTKTTGYDWTESETNDWEDGNKVPLAALVVGNRTEPGIYPYATKVELSNVTLETSNENSVRKSIYVYQVNEDYPVSVTGDVKASWTVNDDMNGASYPEALIDNVYYETFEEAVDAVSKNSTITLLCNVDLTEYTKVDAYTPGVSFTFPQNVTLEMNNKTITSNNFGVVWEGDGLTLKNGSFVCANGGSYALFIGNGGYSEGESEDDVIFWKATVDNIKCVGGINVYAHELIVKATSCTEASGTNYYALWADEAGQITVEGGTFTSPSNIGGCVLHTSKNEFAFIKIKGGTFNADGDVKLFADNAHIEITGGEFSADPTAFLVSDYTATQSGNTWTVSKNN